MSRYVRVFSQFCMFLIPVCLLCLIPAKCAEASINATHQDPSEPRTLGLEDGSLDTSGIRMIASLLVVLALIAAGVFLLKKMMPYRGLAANEKYPIRVLSRVSLGQKRSICLVRIADEILVVGLTNTNISLLSKIDADEYDGRGIDVHENSADYRQSFRKMLDKIGIRDRKTSTAREEGL